LVLDCVGVGGMGIVYSAYDPELDRKVALKVVRSELLEPGAIELARARILREAQAMARLNHPNVVAVHDVQADGNQLIIAMDWISGVTLDAWSKDASRSWEEIVELFIQAGRGLVAAHEANLVHRDFKPQNVLVGDDRRVWVTDFGLARGQSTGEYGDSGETGAHSHEQSPDVSLSLLAAPLTRPGGLVGTPCYMAPEQHQGKRCDARSDQFSFCVALFEALYGRRPSEDGASIASLPTLPSVNKRRVPPALGRIVLKGLSPAPGERHASMRDLVRALQDVVRPPRRSAGRWLVAVAVVVAVVVSLRLFDGHRFACEVPAQAMVGVWDDAVRNAIEHAYGVGSADPTGNGLNRVLGHLEDYARSWQSMYVRACKETHWDGKYSTEILDQRMMCLDSRRMALRGLTRNLIAQVTPEVAQKAISAAIELPPVAGCADIDVLRRGRQVAPRTRGQRSAVERIQYRLEEARAQMRLGKYEQGLTSAEGARDLAGEYGETYLHADALAVLGRLQEKAGRFDEAKQTLQMAAEVSLATQNSHACARSLVDLAWVVGVRKQQFDAAETILTMAAGAVRRADVSVELQVDHLAAVGADADLRGDYDKALESFRLSHELARDRLGPYHARVPTALHNVGVVQKKQGKYEEALANCQRAASLFEELFGPEHPYTTRAQHDVAAVWADQERHERALNEYYRVMKIEERVLGATHPYVVRSWNNIANTLHALGRIEPALQAHKHALSSFRKTLGPEHPHVAIALNNIGYILQSEGNYSQSLPYLEESLALMEKAMGPKHPHVASIIDSIAAVKGKLNQLDDAEALYRRALEIETHVQGPDHGNVAHATERLASILMRRGQLREAHHLLATAQEICTKSECDKWEMAHTQFALARVLWLRDIDRPRAVDHAKAARALLVELRPEGTRAVSVQRRLGEIVSWLRSHRLSP
jgi:serine/threonine-protein kinase